MTHFNMEDPAAGQGALTLAGDLTIQRAQELKDVLVAATASEVTTLVLNLEAVTGADLTALQLLCAAHRKLLDAGKALSLSGDAPRAFREAIDAAGFSGCVHQGDTVGLWKGVSE